MTNDFNIRVLIDDDVSDFREIRLEALRDAPEAFSASYEVNASRPLADFLQLMGKEPDAAFGAFAEGRLIGVAGFVVEKNPKERHKGFMWGVYVRPSHRNSGAGEALVRRVLEHARRHVEILRSGVVAANASAARLYLKLGFEIYGVEPRALKIGDRYFDEQLIAIVF